MSGRARRTAPLELSSEEFRRLGYKLVDRIARHLETMPSGRVTPGEGPAEVRAALAAATGSEPFAGLPETGTDPERLLDEAADLLFAHSLFNGHPRFFGFITSSAAPIGALGDLLAAAVNPNVGGFSLAPVATEIELQTVRWIAELLGFPSDCGGILVSGGNVANFVGLWVARRAGAPWPLREKGNAAGRSARFYCSREIQHWIQKAADLSGFGTDSIRLIDTDTELRMDTAKLEAAIEEDVAAGHLPLLVVGTAGSVSTGAIDPLARIAEICRARAIWFHVDGAYGAPAACLPDASEDLKALALADSVAVDPHKWLYAPLEAGCVLVRDRAALSDTFVYHPPYFPQKSTAEDPPVYFHELGPQNSRGFRALKVWLALRQVGREGYVASIGEDVRLARRLFDACAAHDEIEEATLGLSIATFRFVPPALRASENEPAVASYLDTLNRALLERLDASGEAFVSNAIVGGRYLLRACIVNFRTSEEDVDALPEIVARHGRALDGELRASALG